MNKKPDCIIGIDPDACKSGVALLEKKEIVFTTALRFSDLCEYVKFVKGVAEQKGQSLIVVVEGGWLIHGNWHLPKVCSKFKAAAQGRSVGMNHQTGILIVEYCKHIGVQVEVVRPLQKIWRGHDKKITHEELAAITGLKQKRTNQEERDAALIAWWYAGLPIRIKTK